MPIAQIIVAPDAVAAVQTAGASLAQHVHDALVTHLQPAPGTIQVMVQAALIAPIGCDILCLVQHRASASRDAETRGACATALHDALRAATGRRVRVRLIASDPAVIAACDTIGDA